MTAPTETSPLFWPASRLLRAYERRDLSPVEVMRHALERIAAYNDHLGAYLAVAEAPALGQAAAAERDYAAGRLRPLLGVPVSVKDLFDVQGLPTTLGSLASSRDAAAADSGAVRRLRAAGAVLLGKTNTSEFGQSATTENLLGPPARNPWDLRRTAGGSSGGAAASVAAGLASVALGSDGGGSIRIPAAFCGLVGIKPTVGLCRDEGGFRGMSDFACPGPLARTVPDARLLLEALADRRFPRDRVPRPLRIAWCPTLEGRPVDARVRELTEGALERLLGLGHRLVEGEPPVAGWMDVFRTLVLAEEWEQRGDLLGPGSPMLTDFEARTLIAGSRVTAAEKESAARQLAAFRARFRAFFEGCDLLVLPATAVPAFAVGERPKLIANHAVDWLWGAFPFTPMFNVAGAPAATLPCGLVDGLPVGLQLVAAPAADQLLLDVCEELEQQLEAPGQAVADAWPEVRGFGAPDDGVSLARGGGVAVVELHNRRRNALSRQLLSCVSQALGEVRDGGGAIVLCGRGGAFSAGYDLREITGTPADVAADEAVDTVVAAIRRHPKPVLAAIEGYCIGAGLELAMACDVRVAAEGARFALPATRLGLLYKPSALSRLQQELGRQSLARLVLLNETISGERAVAAGLAAAVAPDGEARKEAIQLAIGALSSVPEAAAATRRVLNGQGTAQEWEGERLRLAASPERRRAVQRARPDGGSAVGR